MIRGLVGRLAGLISSPGPGDSGARQLMRAGFWVFSLRVMDRGVRLLRTIVLSRLLFPEDVGLFGVALLMLAALETFSSTGFDAALIHKRDDIRSFLDSAWTVQVLRGIGLALLVIALAPLAARFFQDEMIRPILQVIALKFVITGFANVAVVHFKKDLEFDKEFRYKVSGALVDFPVAVVAAWILRDAWALVWGVMAGELVRTVMSYVLHPYRPRFRLKLDQARELFSYGRWIMATNAVVFLALQGDDVFVGRALGIAALGIYQVAFRVSNVTFSGVTRVISEVVFPYYSKLQDDTARLKRSFLSTADATLTIALPLGAALFVLSGGFVELFLGDGWGGVTGPLKLLVLAGALLAVHATGSGLFKASGRPERDFEMNLTKAIVMAVTIYPLSVRYGINGVAVSVVLGNAATLPLWWRGVIRILDCTRLELARSVMPAIAGAAFTAACGVVAQRLVSAPPAVSFLATGLAMAIGFGVFELALRGERRPIPAGGVGMLLRTLQSD